MKKYFYVKISSTKIPELNIIASLVIVELGHFIQKLYR
jgi:hypothetical protein